MSAGCKACTHGSSGTCIHHMSIHGYSSIHRTQVLHGHEYAYACGEYLPQVLIKYEDFHYPPHWQYLVIWYLYFCDFWSYFRSELIVMVTALLLTSTSTVVIPYCLVSLHSCHKSQNSYWSGLAFSDAHIGSTRTGCIDKLNSLCNGCCEATLTFQHVNAR